MTTESKSDYVNNSSEPSSAPITVRMIMHGKEVGSIIGKKGDNVKRFREESGAKINISDTSCPERIVSVSGITEQIVKAFNIIAHKLEEDLLVLSQNNNLPKPPITLRLAIPASQCGSLIGKAGAKIKEIRDVTGASMQVSSEMLPHSTERVVSICGNADAISKCICHICTIITESPPKGANIPYRPKPAIPPVLISGGQAFAVQSPFIIPHQQHDVRVPLFHYPTPPPQQQPLMPQAPFPFVATQQSLFSGGLIIARPQTIMPPTQTHEIIIPNDLIGCIIGRGGAKINEIRQLSGAAIKIANAEEGTTDRKVTITGLPETIAAAQYFINASLELHKALTVDLSSPQPSTACTSAAAQQQQPPVCNLQPIATAAQFLKAVPQSATIMPLSMVFDTAVIPLQHDLTTKIKAGLSFDSRLNQLVLQKSTPKFAPY